MSELRSLLSIEMRSLFAINKSSKSKDKKAKKSSVGIAILYLLLIAMVFFYVGAFTYGLCAFNLHSIVPAYLLIIASVVILFFGVFTAGNRIFGKENYDILASMPIKSTSIVISRFIAMYLEYLILALVVMVPGVAVYGYLIKPSFVFYLLITVGTIFIPAIPLVICTLFGTLILTITSKMKHKNILSTIFMTGLAIGIILLSFLSDGSSVTAEQFTQTTQSISASINKIYFPATWFNLAINEFNLLYFALFVLLSLGVVAVTVCISALLFKFIINSLQNISAKHDYKIGAFGSKGTLKTLYAREFKRYFSSSVYVSNTIIGPILATIMAIALCVVGVDSITATLPIDVAGLLPFMLAGVFTMATTSCSSISMEGKHVWVIKSLPIKLKTLLDSKILLNLSIISPFYLATTIISAIAIKATIMQIVWLALIPASIIIFAVVFGITVNLRFHKFDWDREESVVKQSLPSFLGGFLVVILCLVIVFGLLFIPPHLINLVKALICAVFITLTVLLYILNNKKTINDL